MRADPGPVVSRVVLKRGREGRLRAGHLWVYRGEVASIEGVAEAGPGPGDVVDVLDARRNFIGRGFISPTSNILVRILTRDPAEVIDEAFFRRRVERAVAYRRSIAPGVEACRMVFGEADLLPGLIVDKYGDLVVLQTLTCGMDARKDVIVEIVRGLLEPKWIYERNDAASRSLEGLPPRCGFLAGPGRRDEGRDKDTTGGQGMDGRGAGGQDVRSGPAGIPRGTLFEIGENGLRFLIDVGMGQKTGSFLDQRENHAAIKPWCPGARVLDAFSYTGGFAIHAAAYGAAEVVGIDISEAAVEMARRNAELNGVGDRCTFVVANAFDELRRYEVAGESFDMVILDPPAFAKNKRAVEGAFRGYKEINLRAIKLLREGGVLVSCSCSYHMTEDLFMTMIYEAAADVGRQLRVVEMRTQAKDHPVLLAVPETRYLKCAILQVL
ncbi:MAG TPA: class I SAM-dependent rRNA methyltransferase [Firmicutes bacterium]|nr:class I SAM-dependent rRNA methyltransferase [Bacillota bacterium]